ncbi:MAG: hypothetical protein AAGN66_19895 [Acidobacteriota bacterium]
MYGTQRRVTIGGGPPPPDVLALMGVLFFFFTLDAFASFSPLLEVLRLSRDLWQKGFLWQLVTYPVAVRFSGVFFLLTLYVLYWSGTQTFARLGRKFFWRTLAYGTVGGAVVAVLVQLLLDLVGVGPTLGTPFQIMQGEYMIIAVLIAAFALLHRDAQILLFFVLPVKAQAFVWLELAVAFIAFLSTKDFAGFVGVATGIGITWMYITGKDPRRVLRELRLRGERKVLEAKLKRMRKQRGMRIVKDDEGGPSGSDDVHRGPWVH